MSALQQGDLVSQSTLKWLRLVVPGIFMLFALTPLFRGTGDLSALARSFLSLETLRNSVPVVLLGALYIIFNLRRFAWRESHRKINDNIKDRLLAPCLHDALIEGANDSLRTGNALMHVFYKLVDRDPSLTEKANRVRFNGLLWSTVADLTTVGTLGALLYLFAFAITDEFHQLLMFALLALVALLAHFILMPVVTRRHIELSDDQLEFIVQHYRADLCADIRDAARAI